MGKLIVKAKLTNAGDVAVAERGFISKEQIRSVEINGLIDTGAVLVSLPENIVNELGLPVVDHRPVKYANGKVESRPIAGGLLIEIQGRTAETRCIVNTSTDVVLIGQIPLEEMDWMVHPAGQCLVSGHDGYSQGLIEMY
ncbi:MAG: clan AA aspartic protease [SAR324 cluster bacterium]|nr:clan AA aspartic protease [SAR324 cluster bacterium]